MDWAGCSRGAVSVILLINCVLWDTLSVIYIIMDRNDNNSSCVPRDSVMCLACSVLIICLLMLRPCMYLFVFWVVI
jgi:hypothetical protein